MTTTVFTGGRIFVGGDDPVLTRDIVVDGEVIAAVEEPGVARGDLVVDATGMVVTPGLIDAHAHVGLLSFHDQARWSPASQAGFVFANLRRSLDEGFTTLRDLGGVDGGLVQASGLGLIESPRLCPSGQIISQIGGHGDVRDSYTDVDRNPDLGCGGLVRNHALCTGVDEVRAASRQQFRRGATQLKIFVTGGVLSHGDRLEDPQFSQAEIAAAVEVAADRGSYVTAHAHTVAGIHRALAAGVRHFEHGSLLDDRTIGLLAEAEAFVVPTLAFGDKVRAAPEKYGVPAALVKEKSAVFDAAADSVQRLAAAGVRLGSGADYIGIDQSGRGLEIALKARILGVAAAVESATRVNADMAGLSGVGRIQPGYTADLAVFPERVWSDPDLFESVLPVAVMHEGILVRGQAQT